MIDDMKGTMRLKNRICVPAHDEVTILKEAHSSPYSVHPGSTKMYKDLKQSNWWMNMKKNVAEYVAKCLICRQVKIEHQRPAGMLQPLQIPKWKWEGISMYFVHGLPRTQKGMSVIWVIVVKLTKSAHFLRYKKKTGDL